MPLCSSVVKKKICSPGEVTKRAHFPENYVYAHAMRRHQPSFRRRVRQPGFLLQGTLILLPALLLAGAGFYSLRQDRVLAEHEARAQARRIATDMADRFVARLAGLDLAVAPAIGTRLISPEDDPIARLKRSRWVRSGFVMASDGRLLFPAPLAPIPLPAPLNAAELSPAQQDAWLALEEQFAATSPNYEEANRLLAEFLRTQPPERFGAIAGLRTAMLARIAGQVVRCRQLLQPLVEIAPEISGETGIPLQFVAEWQLAETSPDRVRDGILDRLCGRAVVEGSCLSEALIERASAVSPGAAKWTGVWSSHQEARGFYESTASALKAGFVNFENKEWLAFVRPVQEATSVVGVPLVAAKAMCTELRQSSADSARFRMRVAIGERRLLDESTSDEPLAAASRVLPVLKGDLPLRVETWLADAEAFYARQRTRSLRFGALIAASAAAVFIGFFTAWRAFRRQQQLSEMKTNFVSSVSHELRAPIASVRLMAEELAEGESPSCEKQKQYHRFIGQECRRLSAVIENVLDFSRREQSREHFEFEPTDLKTLVHETVELMRAYAEEKDVRLEVVHSDQPMIVEADGKALHRLLVNLIDNAIKHSPENGTVRIGVEVAAAVTRLWVEDDGPGIPSAEHERIFERFYRIGSELRRETQGVGLGLAIVKHIAEVHGGRVSVHSAVGEGSRFVVELPLQIVDSPSLNGAVT
jgi:signal transduction histidine kinase